MGTDAPENMGFTLNFGNKIFIALDPDTREETTKLFNALSTGGKVAMPLREMFWVPFMEPVLINSVCSGCLIVPLNKIWLISNP